LVRQKYSCLFMKWDPARRSARSLASLATPATEVVTCLSLSSHIRVTVPAVFCFWMTQSRRPERQQFEGEIRRKKWHESKPRRGDAVTAQGDDAERDANVCGALCVKGETLGYDAQNRLSPERATYRAATIDRPFRAQPLPWPITQGFTLGYDEAAPAGLELEFRCTLRLT